MLEYADSGDLRQEIQRRREMGAHFTEDEVAFIFLQLCLAMEHLHQRNIMHHDLKPENIMLTRSGLIKLGDFGFARQYADSVWLPVAMTGCGTPYYLSPEALRGEVYSAKSELWSLGIILYELMALHGPFTAANRAELRIRVSEGRRLPLPAMYSQELQSICDLLLAPSPADRPTLRTLFQQSEYLREYLNTLRRSSECSAAIDAKVKSDMFHTISAALRRKGGASGSRYLDHETAATRTCGGALSTAAAAPRSPQAAATNGGMGTAFSFGDGAM